MKVLDLRCSQQHKFEGWFASEEDFVFQCERSLVECPLCADTRITKMLSAPRLNLAHGHSDESAQRATQRPAAPDAEVAHDTAAKGVVADVGQPSAAMAVDHAMQAAWMTLARQVLANTKDVGNRFAEEARKIHYGEAKEQGIRGQATPSETQALLDEGIAVMSLPLPEVLKGTLQ